MGTGQLACLDEAMGLAPAMLPGHHCGQSFGETNSAVAGAGPAAWYGEVSSAGSSHRPALGEVVVVAETGPSVVDHHVEVTMVGPGQEHRRRRPSLSVMKGRTKKLKNPASCVGVEVVVAAEVASWMAGVVEVGGMVAQTVLSQATMRHQSEQAQTHWSRCAGCRGASAVWRGWLEAWRPPLQREGVHLPSWAAPGGYLLIVSTAA